MTGSERSRREIWDERHAGRDPIEAPGPDPTVVAELAGASVGRALDLATGDGRNAIWLALRGWRVTAVDFSAVAIARARARAERERADVEWVLADLLEWHAPARTFDLVLIAFLHLPEAERRRVYGAAAEAVAVGGTLLVIGHDTTNLTRGSGGPQDPAVLFTAPEIARDLEGLLIERAEPTVRELPDGRVAMDAVVRATRTA